MDTPLPDKKGSLRALIVHLHERASLPLKMMVVTIAVGLVVWAVLDHIQTQKLKNIFQTQLAERLSKQAMEDRLHFDRFIKIHHQLVRLFVTQKTFSDYVEKEKKEWSTGDTIQIKYHKRFPEWFPKLSVLRIFTNPHCAILLDPQGRVREVYQSREHVMSPSLLQPTPLLLAKSRGQSFLTTIDGTPYLVASESFFGSKGELLATLMLASPIDEEFLMATLGPFTSVHVIALLTPGENPRILTSSNLSELPVGTPLDTLRERYLVTGEEFFDYGASDLSIKLASFISMTEVESLTKSVLSSERQQRAIVAPVFIMVFVLIMFWITRRIQQLTKRISDFSQHTLGVQPQELQQKGDQVYVLEKRFQRLTEEVLEAREALKKEAEERCVLEKKNMEMERKDTQLKLLQSITETLGVGVITKSSNGLQAANWQMERFAKRCGGLSAFDIQDGESVERPLFENDGSKRIFHISSPNIFDEKILLVQDITEVKAQTEALKHLALHDALTDLPNRTLLYDRLQHAILAGQRENKLLALIMLDLDNFKEINDTLGHHIGDEVLKQVGARLQGVLRKSDTIARFGGDEFAVLLPTADAEHAKQAACKLLNSLEQPFLVEDYSFFVEASAGIVFCPNHGEDTNTLIQRADVAMYVAKQAQCGLSIYDPNQDEHRLHHLELMGELRNAIEREDLILYYQPKINFKTGCFSGVEALVRWQHPQRGFILPDKFILLAERTGLIRPLTLWVLNTAIHQCANWHQAGVEISISVNLSTRNLQDPQLPEEIAELLNEWRIAPGKLELEITESAVMVDPARAKEVLTQLDALGVRLSVDDFGTGYSSLAYLKKLPVDEIKIDKSFVMNMTKDNNDAVIVRSIIDLAHNLGLNVLAEGVDRQEVWSLLSKLGCDVAQGNYISPPLPAEELIRWLCESPWNLVKKDKAGQS